MDAVEEFVRARVHRCVILDKSSDGKPTFLGILSQSSVAALVASKFGKLSGSRLPGALWEQGNKTIEELGLVKKDVVGISPDDPVIEALYHMHEKHISSIAIIRRTPSGNEVSLFRMSCTASTFLTNPVRTLFSSMDPSH